MQVDTTRHLGPRRRLTSVLHMDTDFGHRVCQREEDSDRAVMAKGRLTLARLGDEDVPSSPLLRGHQTSDPLFHVYHRAKLQEDDTVAKLRSI